MGSPVGQQLVRRGPSVPDRPTVSVLVLVLDRLDLLGGCLDTVGRATTQATETVVVANGTPAAALAVLERREDIVLVRSEVNLGFGGGCNLAAEVARGRYLVFVNDDSRLDRHGVDRLIQRANSESDIGAVGSRILFEDGSLQEAGGIIWRDGTTAHVGRDRPADDISYRSPRDVDYCSANGLLVTRSAWDAVGGFDETYYPAYYEDADLCMKLRARGFRVVYEPTATLRHLETQSSSPAYRNFLMGRNRERFRARWRDALVAHDVPPVTDRRGAIDRKVEESRALPPLDPGASVGQASRPVDEVTGPEPVDDDGDMLRRQLRHAAYAIEVKDAFIATLTDDLQEHIAREARRAPVRRRVRAAGARFLTVLPPAVTTRLRSHRGHR